jgi:hypothetical protein
MIGLNIFFAFLMGYWALKDFENGNNKIGYVNLVFSSFNTAVVLNHFF